MQHAWPCGVCLHFYFVTRAVRFFSQMFYSIHCLSTESCNSTTGTVQDSADHVVQFLHLRVCRQVTRHRARLCLRPDGRRRTVRKLVALRDSLREDVGHVARRSVVFLCLAERVLLLLFSKISCVCYPLISYYLTYTFFLACVACEVRTGYCVPPRCASAGSAHVCGSFGLGSCFLVPVHWLFCELRNCSQSSVEGKRAAPNVWQLFRDALQVQLNCVQMLPRKIIAHNEASPWMSCARRAAESLWACESARLDEAVSWLRQGLLEHLWNCHVRSGSSCCLRSRNVLSPTSWNVWRGRKAQLQKAQKMLMLEAPAAFPFGCRFADIALQRVLFGGDSLSVQLEAASPHGCISCRLRGHGRAEIER